MRELLEYRTSLIERLVDTAHEFRTACLAAKNAYAPLESGGWNLHQVAAHVRDVDRLAYGLRARRTAVEDSPEFQKFDGDAYMAEHYSASEPLNEILNDLVEHVEDLAEVLRELPAQAWARESRHAMLGEGLALQTWVERDLAHIEEHLETIKMQQEE